MQSKVKLGFETQSNASARSGPVSGAVYYSPVANEGHEGLDFIDLKLG